MTGGWSPTRSNTASVMPEDSYSATTCSTPTPTLGTGDLVSAYTSANDFDPVAAIFANAL